MRAASQARLSGLIFLALAAVAIACGALLALISLGDSRYIVPVALAFVGAAILIGVALADFRYARVVERRLMDRIDQ